ncbi:MAG: hypothetical protein ACRDJW_01270 [Thermomicrobiales bacterium]
MNDFEKAGHCSAGAVIDGITDLTTDVPASSAAIAHPSDPRTAWLSEVEILELDRDLQRWADDGGFCLGSLP